MSYTVKELSDLAGVTPRTLRYYDQIGLLKPPAVGQNQYRYYDHHSLRRLQQILFFRELDVPLRDIQSILDSPDFDAAAALENHREGLLARKKRLDNLIKTLEKTITALQGDRFMSEKEYFEGFQHSRYQQEAEERWGETDAYAQAQRKWDSYSDREKSEIQQLGGEIVSRIIPKDPLVEPDHPDVQAAVEEYFEYFNTYFYHLDQEVFRSLADMWVEDPRFAVNYETVREGGAGFIQQAVHHFCDRKA